MQSIRTMTPLEVNFLADACKALGHPARVRIMKHLIAEKECVCGGLVEILSLAQSTVSQHLKILKEAGLIQGVVEGPRTCYCVNRKHLAKFNGLMAVLLDEAEDQDAP